MALVGFEGRIRIEVDKTCSKDCLAQMLYISTSVWVLRMPKNAENDYFDQHLERSTQTLVKIYNTQMRMYSKRYTEKALK